jgi:threonine dehydrogenase-like Zn-dependent dehydrogenase
MKALLFGTEPNDAERGPQPQTDDRLLRNLWFTPVALQDLPEPRLLGPDWVVLENRITGICGSDSKQIFLDMESADFSVTAFISFPQVLGHEVIADVVEAGPEANVEVGQRVALNCWLTCGPRGIDPMCPACQAGELSHCWNFTKGRIAPGIHTGNSSDATGGFAQRLPAHDSMCIPVPADVPDEVAVLADPFAVSLHAITRNPPPPDSKAIVWGTGALGTTSIAILRALYPSVEVAAVSLHPAQQALARDLGATVVDAGQEPEAIVVELAEWSGGVLYQPFEGLPIAHPGFVASIYDTVGSPRTLEQGLRVLAAGGQIVVSGVYEAGRFEWSPWYFKDARLIGSNAFGIEEVDGVRQHAIRHYLDMVRDGRVDVSKMLTHTFRLDRWREAFTTIARQHETGAIKVAFDFR